MVRKIEAPTPEEALAALDEMLLEVEMLTFYAQKSREVGKPVGRMIMLDAEVIARVRWLRERARVIIRDTAALQLTIGALIGPDPEVETEKGST